MACLFRHRGKLQIYLHQFATLAPDGGDVVGTTPRPLCYQERPGTQSCRRPCEPRGRSGRAQEVSPQQGFDPRNLQPVESRYSVYAMPAAATTYM
jgi:hypothetical protein